MEEDGSLSMIMVLVSPHPSVVGMTPTIGVSEALFIVFIEEMRENHKQVVGKIGVGIGNKEFVLGFLT